MENISGNSSRVFEGHYSDLGDWKRGDVNYFVVPQRWEDYTAEEHAIWRDLYHRQMDILPGRAISLFMDNLKALGINDKQIPDFDEVNKVLMERTGWRVVGVPGPIPVEPFFELLANRMFPVGTFIRTREQFDYIQEPDVFHDLFGHVPILADPVFADYIEAYGRGGLKAADHKAVYMIGRLYWYTVEFGLIQEPEGLRIYGAGILSSPTESVFALDSPSPNRVKFDVKRLLRSRFFIDDFQDTYHVIESFDELFDATKPDFLPYYEEVRKLPTIQPTELIDSDIVLHKGTGDYAKKAAANRAERQKQKQEAAKKAEK